MLQKHSASDVVFLKCFSEHSSSDVVFPKCYFSKNKWCFIAEMLLRRFSSMLHCNCKWCRIVYCFIIHPPMFYCRSVVAALRKWCCIMFFHYYFSYVKMLASFCNSLSIEVVLLLRHSASFFLCFFYYWYFEIAGLYPKLGQHNEMNNFLKALKIKSVLSV